MFQVVVSKQMIVASPPPRFVLARSDLELWALLNPLLSTKRTLRLDFLYGLGGLQKVAFLRTSESSLIIITIHILQNEEQLMAPPRGVGDGRVGGVQGREGGRRRSARAYLPPSSIMEINNLELT